ncbi:hypothetical protein TREES_T100013309 [Tupaia chinensis]|uniref:Uncharacterized protein n=1 Tax=Tupaia chinensis TaxID=246437 RepID=L9KHQ6_TUPCH|nr:hypothetical protein TREES_T100013309 [Tupaia chinensis]
MCKGPVVGRNMTAPDPTVPGQCEETRIMEKRALGKVSACEKASGRHRNGLSPRLFTCKPGGARSRIFLLDLPQYETALRNSGATEGPRKPGEIRKGREAEKRCCLEGSLTAGAGIFRRRTRLREGILVSRHSSRTGTWTLRPASRRALAAAGKIWSLAAFRMRCPGQNTRALPLSGAPPLLGDSTTYQGAREKKSRAVHPGARGAAEEQGMQAGRAPSPHCGPCSRGLRVGRDRVAELPLPMHLPEEFILAGRSPWAQRIQAFPATLFR